MVRESDCWVGEEEEEEEEEALDQAMPGTPRTGAPVGGTRPIEEQGVPAVAALRAGAVAAAAVPGWDTMAASASRGKHSRGGGHPHEDTAQLRPLPGERSPIL